MRYGSVCSGIEAATVAWHPLGFEPVWFSEIEAFPSAVLNHRFPNVPNLGDMIKIHETETFKNESIDLLVGGTPCQSFSLAGLRKGLDDPRGNLMLTYLAIAGRKRPRWVVWENVPGVFSSNEGRDFAAFLTGLAELGYGFAYRVLDAQYFGVAQRRRRVFVVGYLGDWRPAAAVLFERHSLSGNTAPSRETREGTTDGITEGTGIYRWQNEQQGIVEDYIAASLRAKGTTTDERIVGAIVSVSYSPEIARCIATKEGSSQDFETTTMIAHTFKMRGGKGYLGQDETAFTISTGQDQFVTAIRRLTPIECERLQGFPDDWTKVPWRNKQADDCPDGSRYKACGNSMAVPVMRWIGERIQMAESVLLDRIK